MFPILAGYIAMAIGDRPALMPGIVGGLLAKTGTSLFLPIDFGGPFNKAAYVFGTTSIASGQLDIMSSVMIGGMVPPIAIALGTTFFKNRFTKNEKQTTVTNYIMGLSFITEGAIPFADVLPCTDYGICRGNTWYRIA